VLVEAAGPAGYAPPIDLPAVNFGADSSVVSARQGLSAGAIASLYEQHYVSLCRTARLIVDDPGRAEELVQDAFMRTFAGRSAVRDPSVAPGYLRRAVVHACHSELRRRRVERRLGLGDAGAPLDATTDRAGGSRQFDEQVGDNMTILGAIGLLPARQREAVVLRYYGDLDEAAIAAAMNCSTGTVKSQLARARSRLAELIGEPGSTGKKDA